jgi:hypothetical protein
VGRAASRCRGPAPRPPHDYPLREFDFPDGEESRDCELLCSPVNGWGFRKRGELYAQRLGGRGTGGLKITVVTPVGLHFWARGEERFKPTPFGVDIEVLQSGRRIARVRIAARCDSYGQSSRCRFRKIDTRA